MTSAWYLAYTRPLYEKKVSLHLLDNGIEHFLPMTKSLRVWADRKKIISVPLFPSYVFVQLKNIEEYYECLRAKGILYFIKQEGKITSIKESIIEDLKHLISYGSQGITVTNEQIPIGERLVINGGPFMGRTCETISQHGKRKILVRIDLIQRTVVADLPLHFLLPLQTAE